MKSLVQEYAEYSRTLDEDGSVRPTIDTGFRMEPTEPFVYVARPNPLYPTLVDHVHNEDIATFTPTRLRGVNFITLNTAKAEARITADIRRNIENRKKPALMPVV